MTTTIPELPEDFDPSEVSPPFLVDNVLDDLGIALQTRYRHTQWVPLRELILAVLEDGECRVATKKFLNITTSNLFDRSGD